MLGGADWLMIGAWALLLAAIAFTFWVAWQEDWREALFDDFTGDCLDCPPEVSRPAKGSGAGSSDSKADRLKTHTRNLRTDCAAVDKS